MTDYLTACTAASTSSGDEGPGDPLLDLNGQEEMELPFLTVATVGKGEAARVAVCVLENRCRVERVEGMLAVGIEGCSRVREILDGVVKGYGSKRSGKFA